MGKVVNQTELAEIVGVSDVTLWEWQKQGMPVLERGERGASNRYDTAAVWKWGLEREREKGSAKNTRDRRDQVALEREELDLAEKKNLLVPVDQIAPVWETRVRAAQALLLGRHSRLAGLLEATPGVEAKRTLLKVEDAAFLSKLGVHGEEIQAEFEALLAEVSQDKAAAFMKRIAAYDNQPDAPRPAEPGVGDVRPAEEDPPLGMG